MLGRWPRRGSGRRLAVATATSISVCQTSRACRVSRKVSDSSVKKASSSARIVVLDRLAGQRVELAAVEPQHPAGEVAHVPVEQAGRVVGAGLDVAVHVADDEGAPFQDLHLPRLHRSLLVPTARRLPCSAFQLPYRPGAKPRVCIRPNGYSCLRFLPAPVVGGSTQGWPRVWRRGSTAVSTIMAGVFDAAPRRMRVAMVAPPWYELPPTGYGGIELICAALVDALVARGHDVTLFGAGRRNGTAAEYVSTLPHPQYLRLGEAMPTLLHAARVDRLLAEGRFDVVHDHSVSGSLNAPQREVPTVVTVHGPADTELGDFYAALGDSVDLVAISDAQRRRRPGLPWAATVHNALDPDWFVPAARPDGPVLWLGRFCADKGPDLAIHACRAAGLPLVLAGKCSEATEMAYLDEHVRPLLGSDVELVRNADRTMADRLLAQARCLIMPIRWHEPFGMVMIEAMASGTPVVALR